jgi:6-pyruvoyl-tetrahydropterin synthase
MIVTTFINRLFIADHFHNLPGFIESQHAHNWKVEVALSVMNPDDYVACTRDLDRWINQVNNTVLNNHQYLEGRNPTTELLAQWLYEFLKTGNHAVVRVKIQEKANYWAAYGNH